MIGQDGDGVKAALLVLVLAAPVLAQERPLWGELAAGPHPVGFRSFWEVDPARDYQTSFADGTRYADGEAPRPILVNVWYPSEPAPDAEHMPHRGYLEILSADPRLERFSKELIAYEEDVIAQWTIGKPVSALDEGDAEAFDELLDSPTACVRDAPAAAGRFPLVVYHAGYGSSYEDNSVLCEYLASHGYLVVGSAFQDESGGSFNIDGGEGSARDLAFLIGRMRALPEADQERVAVIGHSGGAHAVLRYQAQPADPADAVISLDTTQDYVTALDPHWSHPPVMLAHVENETTPLLIVASPHAYFQVCDALVNADRTYLTFRDLGHNDYTSQGIFLAEIAARRAAEESAPEADELAARASVLRCGYERCCEYQRTFLDAWLKGDRHAKEVLATLYRNTSLGGAEPHVEHAAIGTSGPPAFDPGSDVPPTPRQVRPLIEAVGAEATLELLVRFHETVPEAPVFEDQFAYALLYELVARGRRGDAEVLAPFFHELHPALASTFSWWVGRSRGEPRFREYCIAALQAALLLEPENRELAKELEALRAPGER